MAVCAVCVFIFTFLCSTDCLVGILSGGSPSVPKIWRVEGGSWRVDAKCARSVLEGGSEKITKKLQNGAKKFLRDFRKVPLEQSDIRKYP